MKFQRRSRLTTKAEYQRVFARPGVSQDRFFRILARHNNLSIARLGLAVPRGVCATAVGRNRLKRVIRESFRQHQEELVEKGGMDVVVLPGRRAATISNRELFESLAMHWKTIASGKLRHLKGKQGK